MVYYGAWRRHKALQDEAVTFTAGSGSGPPELWRKHTGGPPLLESQKPHSSVLSRGHETNLFHKTKQKRMR